VILTHEFFLSVGAELSKPLFSVGFFPGSCPKRAESVGVQSKSYFGFHYFLSSILISAVCSLWLRALRLREGSTQGFICSSLRYFFAAGPAPAVLFSALVYPFSLELFFGGSGLGSRCPLFRLRHAPVFCLQCTVRIPVVSRFATRVLSGRWVFFCC
jgi:hypothetical protein